MHARVRKQARGLIGVVVVALGLGLAATVSAPAEAVKDVVRAAVVTTPCGTAVVKKADGTSWVCTFGDDFTTSKLDTTKWTPQLTATSGYNSGNECFTDSAQNITQSYGVLKLVARKTARQFTCASPSGAFKTIYSSGMVSTYTKFTQTYGRFEIRAKFSTSRLPGLQSALWMYPEVPGQVWPYGGEIDIAEWYSKYPDRVIPYLHYGTSYLDPNSTNVNCVVPNVGGTWHTYVLEWTPTAMTFIYDGNTCMVNTAVAGQYPFNKAYMIALTQLIGVGENAPTTRTALPATTQIDYVHVWS